MKNFVKSFIFLLLTGALLCSMCMEALASGLPEGENEVPVQTGETRTEDEKSGEGDKPLSAAESVDSSMSILDDAELTKLTESIIEEFSGNGLNEGRISIAYTYTATGDTWYYNPDIWRYSASMYKVPLMMILAEKEADGELTQESDVKGLTLAQAEESVLVYSNNDYAHLMLNYLGTDKEAREMYKQFSPLEDNYYHSDFIDYSYFTVRFMNDVMETLYSEPERFPHITDCLKLAMPEDYFHLSLHNDYEIAQKYGSFREFNNTAGIIYTPNPIILTVMTEDLNAYTAEKVIAQAAQLFTEYTLELDKKLDSYKTELLAAEEEAAEEKAIEEAEKKAAEEQRLAEEEAARAEALRLAEEAEREARHEVLKKKLITAAVIIVVLAAVAAAVIGTVKKKRRQQQLLREHEYIIRERYGIPEETELPRRGEDRDAGAGRRPVHERKPAEFRTKHRRDSQDEYIPKH
ncbi:MAG: serine hydrolase [Candidatus Limivicinus sp.]|jgi:hypothetical protein